MKIERYNQFIWAIIGSIIILSFLGTIGFSLFSIIGSNKWQTGIKVKQTGQNKATNKTEEKIVYSNPIITEHSKYIMIPVRIKRVSKNVAFMKGSYSSGSYSKASYIYHGLYRRDFNNIVFYNKNDGKSYLLLNKKAIISCFYFPYEKLDKKDKPIPKFLLFGISENDTNGDEIIDKEDEVICYISDLTGKNLQQLTPPNTQLIDWDLDKDSEVIYIRVKKDSNNDKHFTDQDDIAIFKVSINNPGIGTEIIHNQIRNNIKSIFR